jgi:hypothetical protein
MSSDPDRTSRDVLEHATGLRARSPSALWSTETFRFAEVPRGGGSPSRMRAQTLIAWSQMGS